MKKNIFFFLFFYGILTCYSQEFQLVDTWQTNGSPIECITLTPEGDKILVGHHDGSIELWDLNKKMVVAEYLIHSGQVNTIIFNASNNKFVTTGLDSKVALWEYPSMKLIKQYRTTQDANNFAVLTPDESAIYFGGENSNYYWTHTSYAALYKIDVKTGKEEIVFEPNKRWKNQTNITDGELDPTGKYVVFTRDNMVVYYDLARKKVDRFLEYKYSLNNFKYTGNKLYLWGDKMLMRLEPNGNKYDLTHTVLAGTHYAYDGYSEMAFSSDHKILVTGDDDHNVNIWDAESMIKKQILFGHTDLVRAFVFCMNDTVLITGGYDGQLLIWSFKKTEKPAEDTVKNEEVVFAENNIPLVIRERGVDLQSNLAVQETEFDIQIYDNRVEDGDSISLNLNGKWILTDHRVTKAKKTIHIKIDPNFTNNYLILYAHNLGEIAPNTAALTVLIGGKEYKLSLSSDMKKSGALNFEYKP